MFVIEQDARRKKKQIKTKSEWSTLLTRWIATAALRDGKAAELLALKPVDRLVDDSSIDATAAVECDGAAHDSR